MEDTPLIGPDDTAYRLELTAAQLKITHTALKSLLDDFGHEERDVQAIIHAVLAKLPDEHEIRAIDLGRELAKRRRAGEAAA
jgi:UDP-N-acetylmuramate-alanine ligase